MGTWKKHMERSGSRETPSATKLYISGHHSQGIPESYSDVCQYAFSSPVYEARVLLAVLDYDFRRNRPTMKTAEGKEMYVLHLKYSHLHLHLYIINVLYASDYLFTCTEGCQL